MARSATCTFRETSTRGAHAHNHSASRAGCCPLRKMQRSCVRRQARTTVAVMDTAMLHTSKLCLCGQQLLIGRSRAKRVLCPSPKARARPRPRPASSSSSRPSPGSAAPIRVPHVSLSSKWRWLDAPTENQASSQCCAVSQKFRFVLGCRTRGEKERFLFSCSQTSSDLASSAASQPADHEGCWRQRQLQSADRSGQIQPLLRSNPPSSPLAQPVTRWL